MILSPETHGFDLEHELLAFCEAERGWLIDTILTLAKLESPTDDKVAVDSCGRVLRQQLERMGGQLTCHGQPDAGDHLRAEFGVGASQILLVGHFDTVWPVGQMERMPLDIRDGCLFGPGVLDMKAGIVLGMLATRALTEVTTSPGRVVMLWTSDEERGSPTSRALIEQEARRSDAVFVLEPALVGGGVKTARKGCGEFRLTVRGIAAHAGIEPHKGASAVHELAAQIVDLQRVRQLGSGVSLNVGIAAGGTRPNVVAEEAHAIIDSRVTTAAEATEVARMIRHRVPTIDGTQVDVAGGFDRPPMERTESVARLYEKARAIARRLGHDLPEGATGGGSDGNFTAAVGTPTLDGLGATGAGPHALHEHIEMGPLPWRAAMLASLIRETQVGGEG